MIGNDCKLYYDATPLTSADGSGGTWLLIDGVKDVSVSDAHGEVDATTRASDGRKEYALGLRDTSIEFEAKFDVDETAFAALKTAYEAGNTIAMAAMNEAIATVGATGVAGNFILTGFARSEALEGLVTVSVTAKPHSYLSDYTVSA